MSHERERAADALWIPAIEICRDDQEFLICSAKSGDEFLPFRFAHRFDLPRAGPVDLFRWWARSQELEKRVDVEAGVVDLRCNRRYARCNWFGSLRSGNGGEGFEKRGSPVERVAVDLFEKFPQILVIPAKRFAISDVENSSIWFSI